MRMGKASRRVKGPSQSMAPSRPKYASRGLVVGQLQSNVVSSVYWPQIVDIANDQLERHAELMMEYDDEVQTIVEERRKEREVQRLENVSEGEEGDDDRYNLDDVDIDEDEDDDGDDDDNGDDGQSMTKTNNSIGADQDDKSTLKPAGVSAMSSQQRTIGPVIDQDTISAMSENTSMWDEELDLDSIDVTGAEEDLDDALSVTHFTNTKATGTGVENDGRSVELLGGYQEDNKWLAEIDEDEVRALEEECKALRLQFEDGEGET